MNDTLALLLVRSFPFALVFWLVFLAFLPQKPDTIYTVIEWCVSILSAVYVSSVIVALWYLFLIGG